MTNKTIGNPLSPFQHFQRNQRKIYMERLHSFNVTSLSDFSINALNLELVLCLLWRKNMCWFFWRTSGGIEKILVAGFNLLGKTVQEGHLPLDTFISTLPPVNYHRFLKKIRVLGHFFSTHLGKGSLFWSNGWVHWVHRKERQDPILPV